MGGARVWAAPPEPGQGRSSLPCDEPLRRVDRSVEPGVLARARCGSLFKAATARAALVSPRLSTLPFHFAGHNHTTKQEKRQIKPAPTLIASEPHQAQGWCQATQAAQCVPRVRSPPPMHPSFPFACSRIQACSCSCPRWHARAAPRPTGSCAAAPSAALTGGSPPLLTCMSPCSTGSRDGSPTAALPGGQLPLLSCRYPCPRGSRDGSPTAALRGAGRRALLRCPSSQWHPCWCALCSGCRTVSAAGLKAPRARPWVRHGSIIA